MVFRQLLAGVCGTLFTGYEFQGSEGWSNSWKRFRIVPHTNRLHMAAAVVVRMKSRRTLPVATTPQLAMGENSGNRVCVEHASRAERHRGIGHIQ